MYEIIVMSHGTLAQAYCDTMGMILGEYPDIKYCSIIEGESSEDFSKRLHAMIDYQQDEPLLVLLDLYSGSPCRVAISQLLMSERICHLIAGVNLPLVMEAYASRNQNLQDVIQHFMTTSKENVMYINDLLTTCEKDEENE